MKKILKTVAFLLIFAFAFFSVACNNSSVDATDEIVTEEPTEAPTEKATKKPSEPKTTEPPTMIENTEGLDLSIKVLSQNVRCADDEGGNSVEERTTRFAALVDEYKPDLIGTQETTLEWLLYMRSMKGYRVVGSSRDGHRVMTGEFSAIMYNSERFVLMDEDTFWVTQTPDKVSMTEGAKCRRICTWAELYDRYTGETVIMANTHLDHSNNDVRDIQASYLLLHLKKRLGDRFDECTIYLTGDFNCKNTTKPYERIINGGFTDSRGVAAEDLSTVSGTYHNYGKTESEIDFCFFKGEANVISYEVVSKSYKGEMDTEPGFVSDHYGVFVIFE